MQTQSEIVILNFTTRRLVVAASKINLITGFLDNFRIFADVEHSGIQGEEFTNSEEFRNEVVQVLKTVELKSKIDFDKIYIGVPANFTKTTVCSKNKIFTQNALISEKDYENILRSAKQEENIGGYKLISISPTFLLFDKKVVHEIVGMEAKSVTIDFSCVLCKTVFTDVVEKAIKEYKPSLASQIEYISQDFAQCVTMFPCETRDNSVLMCGVDELATSVSLARGDGIVSSKVFYNGGTDLVLDVMNKLELPHYSEAENMVYNLDLSLDSKNQKDFEITYKNEIVNVRGEWVYDLFIESLSELIEKINRAIKLLQYNVPPHLGISLFGSGLANIKGIEEYLSHELNRSVKFESFKNIKVKNIDYIPVICIAKLVAQNNKINDVEYKNESVKETKKVGFIDKIKNIIKKK